MTKYGSIYNSKHANMQTMQTARTSMTSWTSLGCGKSWEGQMQSQCLKSNLQQSSATKQFELRVFYCGASGSNQYSLPIYQHPRSKASQQYTAYISAVRLVHPLHRQRTTTAASMPGLRASSVFRCICCCACRTASLGWARCTARGADGARLRGVFLLVPLKFFSSTSSQ